MPNTNLSQFPPNPIFDEDRGFRVWHISEIYQPGIPSTSNQKGRYVPNVDDLIVDYTQGFLRVLTVDYSTGASTWVKWELPKTQTTSNVGLLGGYGAQSLIDPPRVFIHTGVMPHVMAVDARYHVHGDTLAYMKVFKGTDIGQHGEIVSAFYDQSGQFMGDAIPLQNVAMENHVNYAVKAPVTGYTLKQFEDGELLTAVFYSQDGIAHSITPLIVMNTAFIHRTDQDRKYIRQISIESPFLSSVDPELIEYPINMPVSALNLMGVVTYSDGTTAKLPVDGTKFSIYGLRNYIATVQGQRFKAVLEYRLGANEFNYMSAPEADGLIKRKYNIQTRPTDGAYSVKMYVFPVWVDDVEGYRLEAFLYNMDRRKVYNVTSRIQTVVGSNAFRPRAYGVSQDVTLSVNMNQVDSTYKTYRHTQTFTFSLLTEGSEQLRDNWQVQFTPNSPAYGSGMEAKAKVTNQNLAHIRIDSQIATQKEWLDRMYWAIEPLFNRDTEDQAPEPNYFALRFTGYRGEFPINQWNKVIQLTKAPKEGETVFIEWIRRTANSSLHLGISGLPCHLYNTLDGTSP